MNGDDPTTADFASAAADRANDRIARLEAALLALAGGATAEAIRKILAVPAPPLANSEDFAERLRASYRSEPPSDEQVDQIVRAIPDETQMDPRDGKRALVRAMWKAIAPLVLEDAPKLRHEYVLRNIGEPVALRFQPGPLPVIDASKANVDAITPTIAAFVRDSVLEEAAKECERQRDEVWESDSDDAHRALTDTAKKIRGMKSKP